MLIDVFPFTNEFPILKARLDYLNSMVDLFILVESDTTYSGIAKHMLFKEMGNRLGQVCHKIMVVPQFYRGTYDFKKIPKDEKDTEAPSYLMEKFQRNGAMNALRGMPMDAVVLIGDVDEIPNQHQLATVLNNMAKASAVTMSTAEVKPYPPVVLEMDHYMYSLKWKTKEPWLGTVVTTNNVVNALSPSKLRDERSKLLKVENGGWHLNNFMPAEGIQAKIQSFAHQQLNQPKYTNIEHIRDAIAVGEDIFDRKAFKLEEAGLPGQGKNPLAMPLYKALSEEFK